MHTDINHEKEKKVTGIKKVMRPQSTWSHYAVQDSNVYKIGTHQVMFLCKITSQGRMFIDPKGVTK